MDKETLELILNAVFDGAEQLLAKNPVLLGIVRLARPVILRLIAKLIKEVDIRLPELSAELKSARKAARSAKRA